MEEQYFESALKSLTKTQTKRRLLQILIALRKFTNVTDRVRKLHSWGSLKYIVSCLQHDSRSIVDATLSILGNCSCLDVNCAKSLVQNHNILPILCSVFEKYDEDSIKGRIFRIAGNLNDQMLIKYIVDKQPEIIKKSVHFFKILSDKIPTQEFDVPSEATILLGIRLLRKIAVKGTVHTILSEHEILKIVGKVFIKYIAMWSQNKQEENILSELIKLIIHYSNFHHIAAIVQLKNTDSGDALNFLTKLVLQYPDRVVKIVINLLRFCALKSDIPLVDICKELMDGINNSKNEMDGTVNQQYLLGLCKIVNDNGSREVVKNAKVMQFLIGLMKDLKPDSELRYELCHHILSTIIMCKYDCFLIEVQIKCGIIDVLTEILQWIFGKEVHFKKKHCSSKKRVHKTSNNVGRKKFKKDLKNGPGDISLDWSLLLLSNNPTPNDRCASPSSSSDISSAPNSPNYPIFIENEDLSDSDNYSPVCSDNEETDHNEEVAANEEEKNDSENETKCHQSPNELFSKKSFRYLVQHEIHTLLKWYTNIKPPLVELRSPELITTLTKAATDLNDPFNSSFDLVLAILDNPNCLIPLMLSDYIPKVYDLTVLDHDNCIQCSNLVEMGRTILDKLTKLAELGCGKGDIAHNLLRSNNIAMKQKLILSVPYIIRNKSILSKLLLNCEGLNIFIQLLQKDDIQELSVRGLCEIAKTQLKIKCPQEEQTKPVRLYREKSYTLPANCKNIVTFKLDDGSLVKADRDMLSEKCDFFNRLLYGDFKESHQTEIVLKNIDIRIFNVILILMEEDLTKGLLRFSDLNVALGAIELADKFILLELSVYLAECVEQTLISPITVPIVYQWSIESGTNILRIESVAFALTGHVTHSERYIMFKKLFSLGYADYLADDIKSLLTRFLRQC